MTGISVQPRNRYPTKHLYTLSAWTPLGYFGQNGVFRRGGIQFCGAGWRFGGHLSTEGTSASRYAAQRLPPARR